MSNFMSPVFQNLMKYFPLLNRYYQNTLQHDQNKFYVIYFYKYGLSHMFLWIFESSHGV